MADPAGRNSRAQLEEVTITNHPHPDLPVEWVSDKIDLDELFKDAKPIGDGSDWAIPGFFQSDEEFEEFQRWLREERSRMV